MSQHPNLAGRVAWITGASRGIGHALAHDLASRGVRVLLGARSLESLEPVAEGIRALGGQAECHALNVAEWASCEAFAKWAEQRTGTVDFLINNAGMGTFRPVDQFLPGEFEEQFRVNVFGTYYMTRLAVPLMKRNSSGHIINVSSLAGENHARMGSGYYASKHAVNGFTKCLLDDLREFGIKATLVCPGSVDTRFHLDAHPGSHAKDQSWMVRPQQVAECIAQVLALPVEATVSKLDIRPTSPPSK